MSDEWTKERSPWIPSLVHHAGQGLWGTREWHCGGSGKPTERGDHFNRALKDKWEFAGEVDGEGVSVRDTAR